MRKSVKSIYRKLPSKKQLMPKDKPKWRKLKESRRSRKLQRPRDRWRLLRRRPERKPKRQS